MATSTETPMLPAAKAEMWRRFPLGALRDQSFAPAASGNADNAEAKPELPAWLSSAARETAIQLSNGQCVNHPDIAGVEIRAMTAEDYASLAERATVVSADQLSLANRTESIATSGGLIITLRESRETPLVISHITAEANSQVSPTILVRCASGVEATIIELFQGGAEALSTPVTGLMVDDSASLHYHRWHDVDADASLLGVLSATVGESAKLNANCFNTTGKLVRLDAEITITGERSDVELNGLSLVATTDRIGLVYRVNHPEPNSVSQQNVRVVVDGKGKHLYDGYIYVGHGANGTDASQNSKSMLLSSMGQAHANPRLEIHTDDVSCAHGATIGFLDDEALFYLRSRGIPEQQAQAMLIEGFTQAALASVNDDALHTELMRVIQQRFHSA